MMAIPMKTTGHRSQWMHSLSALEASQIPAAVMGMEHMKATKLRKAVMLLLNDMVAGGGVTVVREVVRSAQKFSPSPTPPLDLEPLPLSSTSSSGDETKLRRGSSPLPSIRRALIWTSDFRSGSASVSFLLYSFSRWYREQSSSSDLALTS
nr:hypothetical protein Iba_chr11dCG11540 [Ipomoea batatas]